MEPLIAIMRDGTLLTIISGEWADPSAWSLDKVEIQSFLQGFELPGLRDAIFRNSYNVMTMGGHVLSSVETRWEGVKLAVDRHCRTFGLEWRPYIDDPEYTDWEQPGEYR